MKRVIISVVFILAFGFYVYLQKINVTGFPFMEDDDDMPAISGTVKAPDHITPPPATASSVQYKDGEYIGVSADAYYGKIQVKAIIQGGKITDVQFLDSPNAAENSLKVNGMAKPILTQEAITAQSAEVDGATGATFSSKAFKESLASALEQAKKL